MGSYNSRRMADEDSSISHSDSGSDSDSEQGLPHNYAHFLQSLVNSGQVHIITNDYDSYYSPPMPKITHRPNTTTLDSSEFSFITKQAAGLIDLQRKYISKEKNITNMLQNRERGMYTNNNFSRGNKCKIFNRYLPNEMSVLGDCIGKVFCGIFSKDGNCFITASQDRYIRLHNSGDGSYRLFKSFRARDVGWSIIDVAFSPDRQHFVYSTWSSSLHLCSVNDDSEHQEPLSLLNTGRRFCVFSVVFSSDGKELLGGANDGCLYIYDLQRHGSTLKIPAHEYDVNSVVFADDSSHIIYSGGDDGLIKVWDRRTLDESQPKSVGILAGHMDGITFIDSRGDGRHLISNSKDQSIKLWDVRVFSGEKAAEKSLKAVHDQTWDYRWQEVPRKLYSSRSKLEGDTSVMTYRGHVVIKTLVRCRFSPAETTGQRYIYTGCGMGRVIVYDSLTGKIKGDINGHVACVRDVAWHPTRNEILSSSWDGLVVKWFYRDHICA
ncbi:DDB1- and CUL4-associated factor 11 isoform X2 [Anoplophora glabripennis]|uniref:DDB1- and CUL4-associated factor 11 isoform X2 n=1 Tax=Anoplophora glabripennis TaxID=217634 RepID=UPI000875972B|nr:DDB1- and CUL4-associated factor 11 isoform X2 [Anoplophora glabripennis]